MTNVIYNIKGRILTGLLSLILITGYSISSNLNESQAKNYVQNLIDTLFNPNNHSGGYLRSLKDFSYIATKKILNKTGKYENYFSFAKVYNTDLIYQELINESIDFIEKCSKQYAKDEIGKFYYSGNINENTIINNVSKSIRQEITNLVDRNAYLDTGVFTNWYGVGLVNKVHELISKELKAQNTQKPRPTYKTDECPVCFEDFSFSVRRLFLTCGHNICTSCLKQWYKEKGARTTCPICREKIDIKDLIKEL